MPPAETGRNLGKATVLLAAAVLLAVVAERLYYHDLVAASVVTVGLALGLCSCVVYLCAPPLLRWTRWRGFGFAWSYRITAAGLVFVTAVLVVAGAALVSSNNLLYLVLSCMLAGMLLSGLVSRLGLSGLQLHVWYPDHVFARQRMLARVSIRNLKRWFPSFSIWVGAGPSSKHGSGVKLEEVYCPMLAGRSGAVAAVETTFPHRGRFRQESVWLRSRFPFGFVERRARVHLPQEVTVYPAVETSPEVEELVQRLGQEWQGPVRGYSHDLYRIRSALPEDSARFVDWKASARAGGLWVREFTNEDHRRVHILLDRSVPDGTEWRQRFERAIELCAALAWRLHGMKVELRLSSDDCSISSAAASAGIYEILRYLALSEPLAGQPSRLRPDSALMRASDGDPFQVVFTAALMRETAAPQPTGGHFFQLGRL